MPQQSLLAFTSAATLREHFASEQGKAQLADGHCFRYRDVEFYVRKPSDTGRLQLSLRNMHAVIPNLGSDVLTELTTLIAQASAADAPSDVEGLADAPAVDSPPQSATIQTDCPPDTRGTAKRAFASLADASDHLRDPGNLAALANAGGFIVSGRDFTLRMVGNTEVNVTENVRTWTQAIKSLFRLDDASALRRVANRHARAHAVADALHKKIEDILAAHVAKEVRDIGLPAYLRRATACMSMAPGAQGAYLRSIIDDRFYCSDNFEGFAGTDDPAVFQARFSDGRKSATIALSNYSHVEVNGRRCSAGLQGQVLQARMSKGQYGSLHELVRQWQTEQLAAMLQAELDAVRRQSVPGVGEYLKHHRYGCEAMVAGQVFSIDSSLRLRRGNA